MILSNIKQFFNRNKKIFYYLGFIFAVFMLSGEGAFAAEWDSTDPGGNSEGWDTVITGLNWLFKIVAWILGLLTQMVWVFLTPEWVNGWVIGIWETIKQLWILVSNVVYFIFAFLLIGIAFMNIIWKWGDKFQLKQALPKFVVWVLIVPFSWFFVQFIISISSILAASVLSLPFEVLDSANLSSVENTKICTDFEINWSDSSCRQKGDARPSLKTLMKWKGLYWLLNTYTYWIFEIDEFSKVVERDVEISITNVVELWVEKIFHILFIVVYTILVISLALALFTRVVWLWLYMIFSPVFWLLYFFWKENEWFLDWKFSVTQFFWLAMVPVYVSGALWFGLLFIFVAWNWFATENNTLNTVIEFWDEWEYSHIILFPESGNSFKVSIKWEKGSESATKMNNVLNWSKWIFWEILMQLFWLAILWISVMAALKWSKITEAVVQPIADFGKQVWSLVAKSPQYAPVFGWKSATELSTAASTVSSSVQGHYNTKWTQWWENLSPFWGNNTTKMSGINASHTSWAWSDQTHVDAHIKDFWKHIKELKGTLVNSSEREKFMEMIKMQFWDKLHDKVKDSKNEQDFFTNFKKNSSEISTAGWNQIWTNVLAHIRTKDDFAEYFEKWTSSDESWSTRETDIKAGSSWYDNDWNTWANYSLKDWSTINVKVVDWIKQVVDGWDNLAKLIVQWMSEDGMKNILWKMNINSETEVNKTYEKILETGIYTDWKWKYSLSETVGGKSYTKVNNKDQLYKEKEEN